MGKMKRKEDGCDDIQQEMIHLKCLRLEGRDVEDENKNERKKEECVG